jgi:hypothetical protein
MAVTLIKCSEPGWEKEFPTLDEAVTELRAHICELCWAGGSGDPEPPPPRDCRDPVALLSTPCGCEYDLEPSSSLVRNG